MLISIITVVKNDLKRLKKTISSLKSLYNDKNFEHIIIDGISSDNTIPYIKNFQRDNNNVIFNSSSDFGIYDAMNKGFKLSGGDFIIFLNAGDRLIANKKNILCTLEKIIKTEISIICFPFKHEFSGRAILRYPKTKNIDKLPTSHQAMFFSNSFLKKNKFNLNYKFASDFDLYLRCDPKKIIIISEFEPLSIVEYNGFVSENLSSSYGEYKKIISKTFSGSLKIFLLSKINFKVIFIILLKVVFSKSITFKIREFFNKL